MLGQYGHPQDGSMSLRQCSSFVNKNIENNPQVYISSASANQKCCGDDRYEDSGILTTGPPIPGTFICSYTMNGYQWQWLHAQQHEGSIYFIEKGTFDVISDGYEWIACDAKADGTENFAIQPEGGVGKIIGNNEMVLDDRYICYENGVVEQFAECMGLEGPENTNLGAGTMHYAGGSIETSQGPRFCTTTYKWVDDLDASNPQTCEAAGYRWTGSACCGGDTAQEDTYNDKAWQGHPSSYGIEIGGCFQNVKIANNTRLSDGNYIVNSDFSIGQGIYFAFWTTRQGDVELQGGALKLTGSPAYVSQDISHLLQSGQEYRLKGQLFDNLYGDMHSYMAIYVDDEIYQASYVEATTKGAYEDVSVVFTAPDSQ